VLIVSDHGAGGVGAVFYPDKWLEDNGYLRNNIRIQMKNEFKSHYRSLSNSVRRLLGYQPGLWKKLKKRRLYEKTLAFCGNASEMGIYLNVKEKRTAGVVNSGLEYEAVRDEIISGLSEITDPRSGGRVFEWIKPREEVHDGLHSDAAPDIVFKPASGYMVYPGCPDEMFDYGSDLSGWHEPEGILIACGPAIKEDYQLQEAHIADIAPTILYLMGLPIDSKMDGRLLNEIISDDCITSRPPEYFEYSDLYNEAGAGTAYDEDEARIVEEKLKGLGYL
jgi:predicted AlkP superfamily phosphohydrolase/phosphomutase